MDHDLGKCQRSPRQRNQEDRHSYRHKDIDIDMRMPIYTHIQMHIYSYTYRKRFIMRHWVKQLWRLKIPGTHLLQAEAQES